MLELCLTSGRPTFLRTLEKPVNGHDFLRDGFFVILKSLAGQLTGKMPSQKPTRNDGLVIRAIAKMPLIQFLKWKSKKANIFLIQVPGDSTIPDKLTAYLCVLELSSLFCKTLYFGSASPHKKTIHLAKIPRYHLPQAPHAIAPLAGDFGKLKVKPLILLVLSLLLGVPGFWLTIEGTISRSCYLKRGKKW